MPQKRVHYYSKSRRRVYAAGESIDSLVVFQRDGWLCGLCGDPIDPRLRQPSLWCATLDHVVPISEALEMGWSLEKIHTYDNVQAAHQACNRIKAGHLDKKIRCDVYWSRAERIIDG